MNSAAAAVAERSTGELALRVAALRGTAAYVAYLVAADADGNEALTDLEAELRAAIDTAPARLAPAGGDALVADLVATPAEIVVVDARSFAADDWALLDRRRSALAHRGVVVFVTTPASFESLMRRAPNLASWLGGEVFAPANDEAAAAEHRARRLAALRAWASKTDGEVVAAARDGTLPPDPEYAEWLVLLGHGELLDRGAS